jgi:gas vesicle protein
MANKKGMSPVEAGIIGAAAGIAVGATAVALSSKDNREKIGKGFDKVKKMGQEAYSDVKDKMEDVASEGQKKVEKAKETLKSKL